MTDTSAIAVLTVVLGGALLGGFVSGLAGFGTGLVALGVWLHVIEPAPAATLVIVCSVVAQAQTLPAIWHAIEARRVLPMIVPGLVGIPLGIWLLDRVDPEIFRAAVGVLLLGFSIALLCGGPRRPLGWGGRWADGGIGLASGVLGGLAGLSGALPTVWATVRAWPKDERRAVFQTFNLTVLSAALVWHAVAGLVTASFAVLALYALPGTLVGSWLGVRTYRRLSDRRFDAIVLYLLCLSGLALVWSALAR
jgi:uncharacterized membrane protein YfcA